MSINSLLTNQPILNALKAAIGGGGAGVSTVTATAPITSTGGANPNIGITIAGAATLNHPVVATGVGNGLTYSTVAIPANIVSSVAASLPLTITGSTNTPTVNLPIAGTYSATNNFVAGTSATALTWQAPSLSKVALGQTATASGPTSGYALTSSFANVPDMTLTLTNVPIGAKIFATYSSTISTSVSGSGTMRILASGTSVTTGANAAVEASTGTNPVLVNSSNTIFIATSATVTLILQAYFQSSAGGILPANDTNFSAFVI